MKVTVKLFGTLGKDFTGVDTLKGMAVNIPDDARVKDLLAHLDISKNRGYVVSMNNTIAKSTDILFNGATIQIFQSLAGG